MNTHWPCGAVSFAFSLLQEAKHRMALTRKGWTCLALCLGIGALSAGKIHGSEAMPVQSTDDLLTLTERARLQNRLIVMFVTDLSGKCTNCALMERRIISNPAFMNWVDRRAVMGIVDASAHQVGRQTVSVENPMIKKVLQWTRTREVPSLSLYDSEGRQIEYARFDDKASDVIAAFEAFYQKNIVQHSDAPTAAEASSRSTALQLKMITGAASHRLALINNETFSVGEGHNLLMDGKRVAVKCLEIREKSALVQVEGETGTRE